MYAIVTLLHSTKLYNRDLDRELRYTEFRFKIIKIIIIMKQCTKCNKVNIIASTSDIWHCKGEFSSFMQFIFIFGFYLFIFKLKSKLICIHVINFEHVIKIVYNQKFMIRKWRTALVRECERESNRTNIIENIANLHLEFPFTHLSDRRPQPQWEWKYKKKSCTKRNYTDNLEQLRTTNSMICTNDGGILC